MHNGVKALSKSHLRFLYPSIFINFISIRPQNSKKISQYFKTTKALTKQELPNVCWDAIKMIISFINSQMLRFNREEKFSVLSSENEVADEH